MSSRYRTLITSPDDSHGEHRLASPPVRRLSEPNMYAVDYLPNHKKYNSLPQYGRLHGFLQRLNTRRRSRRDRVIDTRSKRLSGDGSAISFQVNSQTQGDNNKKEDTDAVFDSSSELETVSKSGRKNGSSYQYKRLRLRGHHRSMSDHTVNNSQKLF